MAILQSRESSKAVELLLLLLFDSRSPMEPPMGPPMGGREEDRNGDPREGEPRIEPMHERYRRQLYTIRMIEATIHMIQLSYLFILSTYLSIHPSVYLFIYPSITDLAYCYC